ncbi:MAG: terminase family protein [Moheibacter sp.]
MNGTGTIEEIRPQSGYQLKALSSSADILIGGGAAGVGKTFSLLLEPIRHIANPKFGSVIFRRTSPQIRTEGGLWDASQKLYRRIPNAKPKETILEWKFPSGAKVKFSHMEHENNKFDWQGSEIPMIGFDELTHFSKSMFLYMLSRNRSTCGVKPYIRATCNPDPDSWVAGFIEWWIDQDVHSPNYGYPIPERQGVLRYVCVENDNFVWGDTIDEVYQRCKEFIDEQVELSKGLAQVKDFIKSVTFVGGSIYENVELLKIDSGYLGNLNMLPQDEKNRLLGGNWKQVQSDNDIYDYKRFLDIFTNSYVKEDPNRRYITTDIALKGSNKFIVYVWFGNVMKDFYVMDKSKGNEVIDTIKKAAFTWGVSYSNILFDNDGVGQFVDGFIPGAREFNNGSSPLPNNETGEKENYANLKSQCFFHSGDAVNRGEYYIPPEVANKRYDDRFTLKERMIYERKAIKRAKPDSDGKLSVIKKEEMKNYLDGDSPDTQDAFMMRKWFDFKINQPSQINVWSAREDSILGEL